MRTTVDLPERVFKQAKLMAIHEGVPLKTVITRAVKREVEAEGRPVASKRTAWKIPVAPRGMGWHGLNDRQLKEIAQRSSAEDEMLPAPSR